MKIYKEGAIDKAGITGTQDWKCPKCKKHVIKRYCAACDLYYNVCDCKVEKGGWDDHRRCDW